MRLEGALRGIRRSLPENRDGEAGASQARKYFRKPEREKEERATGEFSGKVSAVQYRLRKSRPYRTRSNNGVRLRDPASFGHMEEAIFKP